MSDFIKIKACRGLKRNYLKEIIKKSPIKYGFEVDLYVLNNVKSCENIIKKIRNIDRKTFMKTFKPGVHFSYSSENKHSIVIFTKKDKEIIKNKNALIGLLIHEIEHIHQNIIGNSKKIIKELNSQIKKLGKFENKEREIAKNVIETSIFLLKDLYSNTEIVKKGLSKYILEYYTTIFNAKKFCPEPRFYRNFKKEAERNPKIVETVLKFEFALLSISLPILNLDKKKAVLLRKDISKCYELNIQEIVKRCHLISDAYKNSFSNKNFNKIYFNKVFEILFRVFE